MWRKNPDQAAYRDAVVKLNGGSKGASQWQHFWPERERHITHEGLACAAMGRDNAGPHDDASRVVRGARGDFFPLRHPVAFYVIAWLMPFLGT
jgi:hypothetical protein